MTYPSDLTDVQRDIIKPHFDTKNYGKIRNPQPKAADQWGFICGENGALIAFLLSDFPPYKTVYSFYKWAKDKKEFGRK